MAGVRDRIEGREFLERQAKDAEKARADAAKKAQQDAQPDYIPRATVSSLVAGNAPTPTVRSRQEQRELELNPEVLTPPSRTGGSGSFGPANAPLTVRERLERQAAIGEAQAGQPVLSAAAQMYLDAEERERKLRAEGERRRASEQAELNRRREEVFARNRQIIEINLSLGQFQATDVEKKKVFEVASRKFGDRLPTGDEALTILFTIRELAASRPEWAF